MNTPACGSFPLLLPLSCHSVTSSANFFLSFLFFRLNPLPVCPSFYSFPSIPPHCILLFIIFLLNLKMASSYCGSPFWVFLGMACHLSGHTPSRDALWCTLSMDACHLSGSWMPAPNSLTPQSSPLYRLLLLVSGVNPFCSHSPIVCFLPVA